MQKHRDLKFWISSQIDFITQKSRKLEKQILRTYFMSFNYSLLQSSWSLSIDVYFINIIQFLTNFAISLLQYIQLSYVTKDNAIME